MKNKIKDKDRKISDAYSICNEVVMYSDWVVISVALQKWIQKEFHVGHPGISRIKSLIRSYVYWTNMDRDIENTVKTSKGCALAAKAPSIELSLWPKTDWPWSRIHIDFAGRLDCFYYLIVVDSFSKWPETFRYKKATKEVVTSFLHELFAWFWVLDGRVRVIVSNNGSQFISSKFKEFCQTFSMEHITIAPYHRRSNGQTDRFVDTFKRALREARDKAIQQFLQVYRVTPNKNAPSAMTPAEVMFARMIKSVLDKLLQNQSQPGYTNKLNRKRFKIGEKFFFRMFQSNKSYWETSTVEKQIGNMIYIIRSPGSPIKCTWNK